MKKFKKLTKEDLDFIVTKTQELTRAEMADKLDISKAVLASYLTQLRKLGVDVPRFSFQGNRGIMEEFAKEWKEKNKIKK